MFRATWIVPLIFAAALAAGLIVLFVIAMILFRRNKQKLEKGVS